MEAPYATYFTEKAVSFLLPANEPEPPPVAALCKQLSDWYPSLTLFLPVVVSLACHRLFI